MAKTDKPTPQRPSPSQRFSLAKGYQPKRNQGSRLTSRNTPAKPTSNPPNRGTSGKK